MKGAYSDNKKKKEEMEKLKKLKNRLKAQPSFTIMEFIKIRNIFVKKKIFEFPVYLFDNKSITFFDVFFYESDK